MSILLIMLNPGSGCYILTPLRDRHPRPSIPSQERPLLAMSVCLVPAHVPCCVATLGLHQPCAPCLRNCDTRARETMRVGSDTILNVPPPQGRARLNLAAFLGYRLPSETHTSLFLPILSLLVRTQKQFSSRSPIAPGQARLTWSSLGMGF
jgi:hypothetical protein